MVCVKKKAGNMRLCADYRALNAVTKSDDFSIDDTTSLMYGIGQVNIITTLEFLKGYWAIPMAKNRDFTPFKTHREQCRFQLMPLYLKMRLKTFSVQ